MKSCKVKRLDEVTRQHCLNYLNAWAKKQGNSDRTRFNKFLHLRQCLQFHGISLVTTKDAPKYEEPVPLALDDEELEVFWNYCPAHRRLQYTLLLSTGLRKAEIQTLRWVDLIGGKEPHIRIQSRQEWEYTPKRHHCRDVPIADEELWAQLMRRKMLSKSKLVFTTNTGKPLTHLWEDTQRIFRNAGLDMAKAHPHCIRATYCTTLLRQNVPLPDVMHLMGHKDMASTMRYCAILSKQKRHERVAAVKFNVPSSGVTAPPTVPTNVVAFATA
jgi:integrase